MLWDQYQLVLLLCCYARVPPEFPKQDDSLTSEVERGRWKGGESQYWNQAWHTENKSLNSTLIRAELLLIFCKALLTARFQYVLLGMWLLLNIGVQGTCLRCFKTTEDICIIKNWCKHKTWISSTNTKQADLTQS